jgi:3D (Asp-Asp-Asp) domain-containing protein
MAPLLPARRALFAIVVVAAVLFVFVTRIRDSTEEAFDASGRPRLGTALRFEATAYCKGETTAAGVAVRAGMAAADPALLPLGSVVSVQTQSERQNGIWTVLDTGPEVKGRELDLYIWNCNEALAFGRQTVQVTILRLGWDPQNSAPSPVEQLFRRRERAQPQSPPGAPAPAPVEPSPLVPPPPPPSAEPPA